LPYVDTSVSETRAPGESIRPRSDEELQGEIHRLLSDAVSYADELGSFRTKATEYYKGEKKGVLSAEPGRSSVVLTEVRDAVQQLLPSLVRVFMGPDGVVEFRPTSAKDIEVAEQQTEYCNYVLLEDNEGFLLLYTGFKDALVRRRAVIKSWWEEKEEIESQRLTGLTEDDLSNLAMMEPDAEFEEPQQEAEGRFAITYRIKKTRGRVRHALIAPEDFLYNKAARNMDEAVLVADRSWRTRGELMAMGYSDEELRDVLSYEARQPASPETAERRISQFAGDEAHTAENALIRYTEAYVRLVTRAGDPPELRKICTVGENYKIVNNEPAPFRPYAILIPDPEPHEFEGLCPADSTMDLQDINSHIARGILDSLNLALNPRTGFVEGLVNIGDLMNTQVGALIRMKAPNSLQPVEHRFVGDAGLATLEHFRAIKEDRLGISRASAGLNNDALQSATKSAVDATVAMREHRVELLARVFAETGMKQLFRNTYRLLKQHQNWERIVRLRGRYVPVDPRLWASEPDVIVTVGLGGGTRSERLQTLEGILQRQEAIMQLLGPNNPLVDLVQYRAALAEWVTLTGRKEPDKYWKQVTPEIVQQLAEAQAQAPQQPDPTIMLAEAQIQIDQSKLQFDQQKETAKLQLDQERQANEMALRQWEAQQRLDLERDKLDAEIGLRSREIELKYRGTVNTAAIKADVDRQRAELEADTRLQEAALAIPAPGSASDTTKEN
jgi:hypothetical protein